MACRQHGRLDQRKWPLKRSTVPDHKSALEPHPNGRPWNSPTAIRAETAQTVAPTAEHTLGHRPHKRHTTTTPTPLGSTLAVDTNRKPGRCRSMGASASESPSNRSSREEHTMKYLQDKTTLTAVCVGSALAVSFEVLQLGWGQRIAITVLAIVVAVVGSIVVDHFREDSKLRKFATLT